MTFGPIRHTSGGQRKLGHYEPLGGPDAPARFDGCRATLLNAQSINSAAATIVQFDTTSFDRASAFDAANYAIKLPWFDPTGYGWFEIVIHLTFDSNATGYREAILQLYDSATATWHTTETMSVAAVNGDRTDISFTYLGTLYAQPTGATLAALRVQAIQNSGGALNVAGGSSLAVRYVATTL